MKRLRHPKKRTSDASANAPAEKLQVQSLVKLFPALEADKLERLAAEMSIVRLKRGDRMVDLPASTDFLVVLKGAIAITWRHDSRHQVLVALLAPGEVFAFSTLMPEMARSLKRHAFTDSLVATIDSARLLDIVLGVELGAFKSAMEMTVGWSSATLMRYIRTFHQSPRDRLVTALIEMGAKFGVRDSRGLILNLPITQKDLANLLGASRQKVNAYLGELVRLGGVIILARKIVLVPEKLFAVIGDPDIHYHTNPSRHPAARSHDVSMLSRREQLDL